MKKFLLSNDERKRILEMHYNAMNKPLLMEQDEDTPIVYIGEWFEDPNSGDPQKYCTPIKIKGKFPALNSTEGVDEMATEFEKSLKEEIYKNEILKKSQEDKTLNITELLLIGGASNVWEGVSTPYEIENDFYDLEDSKVNIINLTDEEKKKYKASQQYIDDNKNLAVSRAQNLLNSLQSTILPNLLVSTNYNESPKVEGYIVNTGGVSDEKSDEKFGKDKHKPGQIVKVFMTMCGIHVPKTKVKSCFAGIKIDVIYDRTIPELNVDDSGNPYNHFCNNATYEITGNDIKLIGDNNEEYANLNNQVYHPVYQPVSDLTTFFPQGVFWHLKPHYYDNTWRTIPEDVLKKMGRRKVIGIEQYRNDGQYTQEPIRVGTYKKLRKKYKDEDPYLGRGGNRKTSFTISELDAEKFVNDENLKKYNGNLVLKTTCVNPGGYRSWGGGCHPGAAKIVVYNNKGEVIGEKIGKTPKPLGSVLEFIEVAACKVDKL